MGQRLRFLCVVGLLPLAAFAQEGKIRVDLTGTATVELIDGLVVSPAQIDSGMVEIGSTRTETVTLKHTGEASSNAIEIGAARLSGSNAAEYTTVFQGFETLYPGQSLAVDVQFTPAYPGDKAASLELDVQGSSTPYVILLEARSRYPLTSNLEGSATELDFGSFEEGGSSTRTYTIENEGVAQAPGIFVSGVTFSGLQASNFSSDFVPTILLPGEKLSFDITLSAPVSGTKNAVMSLTHDGVNPEISVSITGQVNKPQAVPIGFGKSVLAGAEVTRGTAAQFGPDGLLYVTEMEGLIHVYEITRNGKNKYAANEVETIDLVEKVPNHNDDGSSKNGLKGRLVTGIHVTGTAANPVIYLASSDPRQAAGPSGKDSNLDTNSGILHKLTKNGKWTKQDLLRGLPRSEENHVPNGLVLKDNKIYLMTGGHTNQGAPSNNFAELPEYALSAAMLEIDLAKLGGGTYDLPTLQGGATPFGGDNGNNQAILEKNGPVSIYASGFRNAYDLVLSEAGKFYTFDNGPNAGWGGVPVASCDDTRQDGGQTYSDNLHSPTKGYYAGHPNPTRGSKNNTWGGKSPIEGAANPEECTYKVPGSGDNAMMTLPKSTNGMDEYTASNFDGALSGSLIAAAFNEQAVYAIELNAGGNKVTSTTKLFKKVGKSPLDVTSQGDGDIFPGTIWVIDNGSEDITVFEPNDY